MITALIIDDEERSRRTLTSLLLSNFPEIRIVGYGEDVKSGVEQISKLKPGIVFLDIQMPDGTAFDLLHQIDEFNFEVIFTTAYDEYALEAFHQSAVGYLLKPIDEEQFRVAVQKAVQLTSYSKGLSNDQLKVLLENYERDTGKIRKLVLPDSEGFMVVSLEEIIRLEGDRNYTRLHFIKKQPALSSHNLGWFERQLSTNKEFFRVSKSNVINLHHVVRYSRADGGVVLMADGASIQISDTKKEEFRNLFL